MTHFLGVFVFAQFVVRFSLCHVLPGHRVLAFLLCLMDPGSDVLFHLWLFGHCESTGPLSENRLVGGGADCGFWHRPVQLQ